VNSESKNTQHIVTIKEQPELGAGDWSRHL